MSNRTIIVLVALAIVAFLVTQTFYTVDPTKQVLVRQFGAIVGEPKTEPGLYAKIPLIQDVVRIDSRLLDYEAEEFEIIAGDQKRLVVDAYARFRIVNPRLFVERVPGGEPALTSGQGMPAARSLSAAPTIAWRSCSATWAIPSGVLW